LIKRLKLVLLENYLDVRLKLISDKNEIYNFPELVNKMQNVLIILPLHAEEIIQTFPSRLYLTLPQAKISTFDLKGLRKIDCNWLGVPNEHYLNQVRDGSFDLVIDLNTIPNKMCSYITAFSGASMRINLVSGRYDHIYNLFIRSDNNKTLEQKLDNIIKYLQKLKKYYLANLKTG
jgi:hypothetical protein